MYIQKEITTGFGFNADCWVVGEAKITYLAENKYRAEGNFSLFFSEAARQAGSKLIDNVRYVFNDLTDADLDGNTRTAIINRLMDSRIEDGEEMNIYSTSHSGQVSFQDAVIVP